MLLLLLACQFSASSPLLTASPKESGPVDTALDSGVDSGDSSTDSGTDSGEDSGDSGQDTGCGTDSSDTGGCSTDSADSGRMGYSAAEQAGDPGGFGCNSSTAATSWVLLGMGLLFAGRRTGSSPR